VHHSKRHHAPLSAEPARHILANGVRELPATQANIQSGTSPHQNLAQIIKVCSKTYCGLLLSALNLGEILAQPFSASRTYSRRQR
jgi:hypothetical protein